MRDHATIKPTFWTRGTGKQLRGDLQAQVVAFHLMTSQHVSMVGIYPVAIPTIAHETGMTIEGVREGLRRCIEAGFAQYDEEEELAWVPGVARHQVGETLKPNDKRKLGVVRALKPYHHHRFYDLFVEIYADAYGLGEELERRSAPSSTLPLHASSQERAKPLPRGIDPDPDPDPALALVPDLVPEGVQGGESSGSGTMTLAATTDGIDPACLEVVATLSMNTGQTFDVPLEWALFQADCREKGKLTADRRASWEKWLLRAVLFAKQGRQRPEARRHQTPTDTAIRSPSRKLLTGGGSAP